MRWAQENSTDRPFKDIVLANYWLLRDLGSFLSNAKSMSGIVNKFSFFTMSELTPVDNSCTCLCTCNNNVSLHHWLNTIIVGIGLLA